MNTIIFIIVGLFALDLLCGVFWVGYGLSPIVTSMISRKMKGQVERRSQPRINVSQVIAQRTVPCEDIALKRKQLYDFLEKEKVKRNLLSEQELANRYGPK